MKRLRRILFNTLTAISLLLMAALFVVPESLTIGRWFILSQYNRISIQKYSRPTLNLEMPFWLPLMATLVFPVSWILLRRIDTFFHRVRRKPGHCPACGYDMRANLAKCSECGHEVKLAGDSEGEPFTSGDGQG